jgi:hypothetical protein
MRYFDLKFDKKLAHIDLYNESSGLKIYYSFLDCKLLRDELCTEILKIGDVQKRSTNLNADMTDWAMQNQEPFKSLASLVQDKVTEISDLYFYRPDIKWQVKSCWGAKYGKGDSSLLHDHYPATWSASFYASAPVGSSPIIFPGPGVSIVPTDGLLLIFPGNIEHEVPPSTIVENRIIISMNFYVEDLKNDNNKK